MSYNNEKMPRVIYRTLHVNRGGCYPRRASIWPRVREVLLFLSFIAYPLVCALLISILFD